MLTLLSIGEAKWNGWNFNILLVRIRNDMSTEWDFWVSLVHIFNFTTYASVFSKVVNNL